MKLPPPALVSSSRVATYVNTFFEDRVRNLFALAEVLGKAFAAANLDYAVIGGLATYLYVETNSPNAGSLTRDIDIVVRRVDLPAIVRAVEPYGLEYRHVAGIDMLLQSGQPARRAIHIVFSGEKVMDHYPEATPDVEPVRTTKLHGIRIAPVDSLIRMKLSSFRLQDQMHLKDLDEAGVITPDIVASLSQIHRQRLEQVRAVV